MKHVFKGEWINDKKDVAGHYLILPGSNSCWCGFKSKEEAETCLLVLPEGWRYIYRGE